MLLFASVVFGDEKLDLPEGFKADPDRPDVPFSFSAARKYLDDKLAIQAKYRSRLADALEHADGAEIMLLSFTPVKKVPEGKGDDYFPIMPYKSFSQILQRKKLEKEKIAACRKATVELLREADDHGGGAACHFPIHAVRLFRGKEIIFETSFCWVCHNYFVGYPDDFEGATWVGLFKTNIEAFLLKEMPIPQTEIDRFDATYGDKDKSKPRKSIAPPAKDNRK
jgi:hypothetical protein